VWAGPSIFATAVSVRLTHENLHHRCGLRRGRPLRSDPVSPGVAALQPNKCADFTCDVGGECAGVGTNVQKYCDGFINNRGEGVLACTTNDDCDLDNIGPIRRLARACWKSNARASTRISPRPEHRYGGSRARVDVLLATDDQLVGEPRSRIARSGSHRPGLRVLRKCADGSPWGPGGANCQ